MSPREFERCAVCGRNGAPGTWAKLFDLYPMFFLIEEPVCWTCQAWAHYTVRVERQHRPKRHGRRCAARPLEIKP